ncbi:hypothetical protein [uncultured Winogradskyella sp.]|uniref:hypothetical protein n=1 Tax=uncultured Winogradskyella sp. TaxID=395353 RepID=UPI00260606FF|nr:hypothetical protein [uncultured Winogradskyella sp.]
MNVTRFNDAQLIKILNYANLIEGIASDYFDVKVYSIENDLFTSKDKRSKSLYRLLIAVSESDEFPQQSVYDIGPLLNPVIVDWVDIKDCETNFIIEHGNPIQRKQLKLYLNTNELVVINQ